MQCSNKSVFRARPIANQLVNGSGPGRLHFGQQGLGILFHPGIATRFQQIGTDGNGRQTAGKGIKDIKGVNARTEGEIKSPLKLLLQPGGQVDADRVQCPARHIAHGLGLGKTLVNIGGFQGIGELEIERHPFGSGGIKQGPDQLDGIWIFQVMFKGQIRHIYGIF